MQRPNAIPNRIIIKEDEALIDRRYELQLSICRVLTENRLTYAGVKRAVELGSDNPELKQLLNDVNELREIELNRGYKSVGNITVYMFKLIEKFKNGTLTRSVRKKPIGNITSKVSLKYISDTAQQIGEKTLRDFDSVIEAIKADSAYSKKTHEAIDLILKESIPVMKQSAETLRKILLAKQAYIDSNKETINMDDIKDYDFVYKCYKKMIQDPIYMYKTFSEIRAMDAKSYTDRRSNVTSIISEQISLATYDVKMTDSGYQDAPMREDSDLIQNVILTAQSHEEKISEALNEFSQTIEELNEETKAHSEELIQEQS